MADEMRPWRIHRVHQRENGAGQLRHVAAADRLRRAAMPRQVDRIDRPVRRQRLDVEHEIVGIAAEPMDQDRRHRLRPRVRRLVGDRPARPRRLALGEAGLGALLIRRIDDEPGDEGIDVGVRHAGGRDHAQQRAHRQHLPRLRHLPAQHARGRALQHIGDLGAFDLGQLLALGDRRTLAGQPGGERSLLHGQPPFGDGDSPDLATGFAHRPVSFASCLSAASPLWPHPESAARPARRDPRAAARTAPACAAA